MRQRQNKREHSSKSGDRGSGRDCYPEAEASVKIRCAAYLNEYCRKKLYETNTGKVIIETFETRGIKPVYTPGVLCTNHGPFTWGKDAAEAVHNAVVLEEVAKMATRTELINPKVQPAPDCIRDKHFFRKHGANAYYGQN